MPLIQVNESGGFLRPFCRSKGYPQNTDLRGKKPNDLPYGRWGKFMRCRRAWKRGV